MTSRPGYKGTVYRCSRPHTKGRQDREATNLALIDGRLVPLCDACNLPGMRPAIKATIASGWEPLLEVLKPGG